MKRLRKAPPLVESWDELTLRLMLTEEDLERMLEHLESRLCQRKYVRAARGLKAELREALEWIDLVLQNRLPIHEECAEQIVLDVWEFEQWRPTAVDLFHALLEAQGESVDVGGAGSRGRAPSPRALSPGWGRGGSASDVFKGWAATELPGRDVPPAKKGGDVEWEPT